MDKKTGVDTIFTAYSYKKSYPDCEKSAMPGRDQYRLMNTRKSSARKRLRNLYVN